VSLISSSTAFQQHGHLHNGKLATIYYREQQQYAARSLHLNQKVATHVQQLFDHQAASYGISGEPQPAHGTCSVPLSEK
jgi:hypothetical protein